MSSTRLVPKIVFLAVLAAPLWAADSVSFSHKDWELACDNTRTCRAAGYQREDDELAVAVLLTRLAGPGQPVTGEVMIGSYFEPEAVDALPDEFELALRIDAEIAGSVTMSKDSLLADMSSQQVDALLDALTGDSVIEWVVDEQSWILSDSGSTAVLLKMDEFQGRLDTPGALVRKGTRDERTVLPALAAPKVSAAALAGPEPGDEQFIDSQAEALVAALRTTLEEDYDCWPLAGNEAEDPELEALRLSNNKLLISVACSRGSYNTTNGYWVVADKPPYEAELITTEGSDFSEGNIYANSKGRGLGDCWSLKRWTWNGERFVHSSSTTTGMCRGIAPGGAWSLPTVTTDIGEPTP